MKKFLRFVGQAVCILLVAAGLLAALFATFCLVAMLIVWFQEGALQPVDWPIVAAGAKWLLGSVLLVAIAWWLRGKIVPDSVRNNRLGLVDSKSGHSEKLVQNVVTIGSFFVLAASLWPRVTGSFSIKIQAVSG